MKKLFTAFSFIIFIFIIGFVLNSCERPTEPARPNLPPNTTMANIPKEGDTLFALVDLFWDGEDYDGFVNQYQYRYLTIGVTRNDTTAPEWQTTKETSLTVAFKSDDILNYQIFQVRAVDNWGAVDPTPTEKRFYTARAVPPTTSILYPRNNQNYFVVTQPTDWWEGIRLDFVGHDQDGKIVEYAWSVDDGSLTWTPDTTVIITPDKFKVPLSGEHTIKVITKDNTNLVDEVGAVVKINLVNPSFDKKVLVIDATTENNFPASIKKPTDAQVDDFYSQVFPGSDQWDLIEKKEMPPPELLGQYKVVVWHSDDMPFTKPHVIKNYTEELEDYLNVGGKLIIGGWRILKSFAWDANFPVVFEQGTFVNEYLHIVSVDETPLIPGDMNNCKGVGNLYSTIKVDSVKLAGFPYNGKLSNVNIIELPAGFTDGIYTYQNANNSTLYRYRGKIVGLRYYGTVFDAVIFGFPLYVIQLEDAKQMAKEVLTQMGVN
ncbi:MAG: hypothetical protein NTX22_10305 [Ignavibacteriales bacterium]|nr:hypothetical protein [Ignavibacteriales bacterium]